MVKNFLRILICPLDWGLGHASRMVPVIKLLIEKKHHVILAADERPFFFFNEQFPETTLIKFPGFKVTYPGGKNMPVHMLRHLPGLAWHMYKEHRTLKHLIRDHSIDVVISDNRFGLWSKETYCIYITHQINIKTPRNLRLFEPFLGLMHRMIINRYDECWIPDLPGLGNLAGGLSHPPSLPSNSHYIGWLSRFGVKEFQESQRLDPAEADMLVILSGPEPQRSILERMVMSEMEKHADRKIIVLRGLPGNPALHARIGQHTIYNHLDDESLASLIRNARVIVCRSGYSSLMDLVSLGRSAVLVPTPGQTEQEYLAGYLQDSGQFVRLLQSSFTLDHAWELGRSLPETVSKGENLKNDLLLKRVSGLQESFKNE